MRLLVAKLEMALGAILLTLTLGHFSWCRWSIPRHGQMSPHGLETAVCNWGTELTGVALGAIGLLTFASGLIGYGAHRKTLGWYAAQLPAIAAWGWVGYALIHSFFVYPD
jgi:hypothetical protein